MIHFDSYPGSITVSGENLGKFRRVVFWRLAGSCFEPAFVMGWNENRVKLFEHSFCVHLCKDLKRCEQSSRKCIYYNFGRNYKENN